jgi:hypothetical protein
MFGQTSSCPTRPGYIPKQQVPPLRHARVEMTIPLEEPFPLYPVNCHPDQAWRSGGTCCFVPSNLIEIILPYKSEVYE